jgi:hypothetical protein
LLEAKHALPAESPVRNHVPCFFHGRIELERN